MKRFEFQGSDAMLTFWRVVVWIGCGGLALIGTRLAMLGSSPGMQWWGWAAYTFCLWLPFLAMVVLGLIAQWAIKGARKAREEAQDRLRGRDVTCRSCGYDLTGTLAAGSKKCPECEG